MQRPLFLSDPRAAFRRVYFTCEDNADPTGHTKLQASDMGSFTIYISKNGGTPALVAAAAPTEVGATNQKGVFYVELAVADVSAVGMAVLRITNAGGTKAMAARDIDLSISLAYFTSVTAGTLTTGAFTCDRAETGANFWKNCLGTFLTGANSGQLVKVAAYATGLVTLSVVDPFAGLLVAPTIGDVFEFLNR